MLPDPCGEIVEWVRVFGKFKARMVSGGPVFSMLRFEAMPGAKNFPLVHRFDDKTQQLQKENPIDQPDRVGELTQAGKVGYGFVKAPSHKYQWNVLIRKKTNGIPPPGADGQEYHGTPASFLCELEADGTWGGKFANPISATEEELAAFPECVLAKWRDKSDSCECETSDGLGLAVEVFSSESCECETSDGLGLAVEVFSSDSCECETSVYGPLTS